MARNSLALALVSLVLWAMAAATTGIMGPLSTYREAIMRLCEGRAGEGFRQFWAAAETCFCLNDLATILALVFVAVHLGSLVAFACSFILTRNGDDRKRSQRHNHPPLRGGFSERSDNR